MFRVVGMALVSLFGIGALTGCAAKVSTNKTQNITCLGFCTSTQVEHSTEGYPPKENP